MRHTHTHTQMFIHMTVCIHTLTPTHTHTHSSSSVKSRPECVCPAGRPHAVKQQPPAVNQKWNPADIIFHLLADFLTLTG